jgi:hypothetical protein
MSIQTAVMVERVPAKMSFFNGSKPVVYDISLQLMIRDIWQKDGGLLATEIMNISLAVGSSVPDGGPYILLYISGETIRARCDARKGWKADYLIGRSAKTFCHIR